jgi:zinc transport system ATP-binding protein
VVAPLRRADRDFTRHALESVGLEDLAHTPLNELSGGQQQRAFIARAFASEPDLLLLDEPIAGVDAEAQLRFRRSITHLIEEHGAGVLLVSHELSAVVPDLDRVVVLKRRVLFDGRPDELAAEGVSLGVHREDLPLWLEGLR